MTRWLVLAALGSACGASPSPQPPHHEVVESTSVRGFVVDERGAPMVNFGIAMVRKYGEDLSPKIAAVHDAAGRFAVPTKPGLFEVVVVAQGYVAAVVPATEVKADRTSDLGVVHMSRGRTLTGVVTDESGAPFAHARVEVATWHAFIPVEYEMDDELDLAYRQLEHAETRADGTFTLTGVAPPDEGMVDQHQLRVTAAGLASLPEDAGDDHYAITLHPTGSLTIALSGSLHATAVLHAADGSFVATDLLPEDYEYSRLPHGDYEAIVEQPGGVKHGQHVAVEAGKETRVELVAQPLPPVEVRVHVKKFACTAVEVHAQERFEAGATVTCSGRDAVFPALESGEYLVCAEGHGRRACTAARIEPGSGTQAIELD